MDQVYQHTNLVNPWTKKEGDRHNIFVPQLQVIRNKWYRSASIVNLSQKFKIAILIPYPYKTKIHFCFNCSNKVSYSTQNYKSKLLYNENDSENDYW